MAVINLLPLAPFTLTNMLAGTFHLRFRDYLMGSLVGIVPWIIGLTLLSSQLRELLTAENRTERATGVAGRDRTRRTGIDRLKALCHASPAATLSAVTRTQSDSDYFWDALNSSDSKPTTGSS